MAASKEIKGQIKCYSKKMNRFAGSRASIGILISGVWRNLISSLETIEHIKEEYPPGTFLKAMIYQNRKGFWDLKENTFQKITKEQFENSPQTIIPVEEVNFDDKIPKPNIDDNIRLVNINLLSLMKSLSSLEERVSKLEKGIGKSHQ